MVQTIKNLVSLTKSLKSGKSFRRLHALKRQISSRNQTEVGDQWERFIRNDWINKCRAACTQETFKLKVYVETPR